MRCCTGWLIIMLAVGLFTTPLASGAQRPGKIPRVGFLRTYHVPNLEEANKVFANLRAEKPAEVILHVLRGQTRLFLKVSPDWD